MVSVIIPTYNREKTIEKSVRSVLNQSYKDLECIVIDDCSTDNTEAVLNSINDNRLRCERLDINSGACIARNQGINYAKGEYIAFQDSDDIWHIDKLEKQIHVFQKYNADIVFCKMVKYNNGLLESESFPRKFSEGYLRYKGDIIGIGTQSIIAKRCVFERYKFDSEMPRFQDLEWLMRVLKDYNIYCVSDSLVDYYVDSDSISKNNTKLYKACELLKIKHPDIKSIYPEVAKYISRILYESTLNGKSEIPNKEFYRTALYYDSSIKSIIRFLFAKTALLKTFRQQLFR